MTFVRDRALVRRLAGMRGFGDSQSPYTNPDGSPTYDSQPYDTSDPNNPFNYDNQVYDANSLAAAGYVAPTNPLTNLPTFSPMPLPVLATPTLVNYTPGGNAGTAISASGLPASTLQPPAPALNLNNLASSVTSIFGSLFGAKAPTPIAPAGGVVAKPAATAMSSTSLLLLAGLGIGAFVLLKKRR